MLISIQKLKRVKRYLLHIACQNNNKNLVELLISHNSKGLSVLHYSIFSVSPGICKALIVEGAKYREGVTITYSDDSRPSKNQNTKYITKKIKKIERAKVLDFINEIFKENNLLSFITPNNTYQEMMSMVDTKIKDKKFKEYVEDLKAIMKKLKMYDKETDYHNDILKIINETMHEERKKNRIKYSTKTVIYVFKKITSKIFF